MTSIIFYCSIVEFSPEPEPECAYTGQYRLAGNQTGQYRLDSFSNLTGIPFSLPFISGYLEICVNGTYYSVCANDSYSRVNFNATASFVCEQLGYNGVGKISTQY